MQLEKRLSLHPLPPRSMNFQRNGAGWDAEALDAADVCLERRSRWHTAMETWTGEVRARSVHNPAAGPFLPSYLQNMRLLILKKKG